MFYTNRYGGLETAEVADLEGAEIVDNCGTILLPDGRTCTFRGHMNPEKEDEQFQLCRELIEFETSRWIVLPVVYEED